jgi:hypothetical protein
MAKKQIDSDTAKEIARELAELRAQLESQKKSKKKASKQKEEKPKKKASKQKEEKPKKKASKQKEEKPKKKASKQKEEKPKKKTEKDKKIIKAKKEKDKKIIKAKKEKDKKKTKAEKQQAIKDAKAAKEKAEAEAKAAKEAAERTPEDDIEEEFSDEQIRNFQIEKMDMDKLSNKVCEIIADFEEKGMLQSDLWKKLKLNSRDGSRLALRLERRGLISREKILQKGRWTYKLIIEQAPIKLESLVDSPCLTCPVEQKCDSENAYPEPSPLHCQLIEDWVAVEISNKKK